MSISLTIDSILNGWIIYTEEEGRMEQTAVFQHREEDEGAGAMKDMLYYIMEELGYNFNRHSQKLVFVEIRHGDLYEKDKVKECDHSYPLIYASGIGHYCSKCGSDDLRSLA